jgi:hypothetical protein
MALQSNAELRLLNGLLSTLFLALSFQFLILHLLICVCTQFHHVFLVFLLLVVDFPED